MRTTPLHLLGSRYLVWIWLCVLGASTPLLAQGYRTPQSWVDDDFGPPPSYQAVDTFHAPAFESGRRTFSRDEQRDLSGYGSRDPARRPWLDEEFMPELQRSRADRNRQVLPSRLFEADDFLPQTEPAQRGGSVTPRDQSLEKLRKPVLPTEWDNTRDRAWDRNPPTPVVPTVPAQPTLREKIAKRYQDPRVLRVLQQLTPQTGESLYIEVSQLIDSRHVTPTTYQQRVQGALDHLALALDTPAFLQAVGTSAAQRNVQDMKDQLAVYGRRVQVQTLSQAVGVMREVGQMAAYYLNVNPAVVSLPFVFGALDTLDQYSMFIAPEKSGSTNLGLKENMVGIGVEIESHPEGVKILKALAGGPAAEATLRRGDIITAVDGRPLAGLDLSVVADLIGGPAGTPVKLDLRRGNLIGDVTLVRRPFKVQSVSEARLETAGVGYIKLEQFSESSPKELDAALWKLHQQGMQALILDLRGNPGGLLTAAVEITDRFLPSGTIVTTRGRTAADNTQETAQYAQTWKVPLVVLIDQDSASASEILAAAIKENRRGLVVGTPSYGKGTVQTLFPLQSVTGALRLTTAKFYSPEGREMAGVGVKPDIVVSNRGTSETTDAALLKALEVARDPRLAEMADQLARTGRTGLRVIRVAA